MFYTIRGANILLFASMLRRTATNLRVAESKHPAKATGMGIQAAAGFQFQGSS